MRIGDITQDGTLRSEDLVRIEPNEPINENLWLNQGDVLFPNRGTRTTALAFPIKAPRIIAGSQFFIARPDRQRVLPEYLAWFLRSAQAAVYFESRRKGSYVQIIQRRDLAELIFPLPPIAEQHQIVAISALALEERELTERLQDLKWRYVNERLIHFARSK